MIRKTATVALVVVLCVAFFGACWVFGSLFESFFRSLLGSETYESAIRIVQIAAIILIVRMSIEANLKNFETRIVNRLSKDLDFRQKQLTERLDSLNERITVLRKEQEFQHKVLNGLCLAAERQEERTLKVS